MSVLHPQQDRLPLLDLLRPPEGYRLDEAVGTTYSLDLIAMLVLPIGFTWMDLDGPGREAPTREPLKVLEAMRSMRDRLTIFCQAGRIKSPARHPRLVALLEDSLIEARALQERGSFHPKTWALRFVGDRKDDLRYRLLTLSRNVTFDRCWDTAVAVEGTCRLDLSRGRSATRPLRDFYSRLNDCAVKPLPILHRRRLERFASELHRTDFEPPAPFEEVAFHAIGLDGPEWEPFDRDIERILVMSPFVDAGFLKELRTRIDSPKSLERLISRPETLDELGQTTLAKINIGVLDQVPDPGTAADGDAEEAASDQRGDVDDSGLHAKLYLIEKGRWASLLTGSANATARAFERNIEFLIELSGKKDKVGIDAVLGNGDGGLALGKLIQEYQPQPEAEALAATRAAERELDEWCRRVASMRWHIEVTPVPPRGFLLGVRAEGTKGPKEPTRGITTRVVPIGASRGDAAPLSDAAAGATFNVAGLAEVSSLLLVHAALVTPDATVERSFTTVAQLHGAPADRLDQLVSSEISRSGGLVEWLYLMLGQEPPLVTGGGSDLPGATSAQGRLTRRVEPAGLFEVLVREAVEGGTRLTDARRALDGLNSLDTADPMVPKIRTLLEQLVGGLDDQT